MCADQAWRTPAARFPAAPPGGSPPPCILACLQPRTTTPSWIMRCAQHRLSHSTCLGYLGYAERGMIVPCGVLSRKTLALTGRCPSWCCAEAAGRVLVSRATLRCDPSHVCGAARPPFSTEAFPWGLGGGLRACSGAGRRPYTPPDLSRQANVCDTVMERPHTQGRGPWAPGVSLSHMTSAMLAQRLCPPLCVPANIA